MNGKQLKNSILQWAIQGKLVPQDPNDEPASVLLERIREEKARLVKEKKIKKDKNESIIFRGDDNSHYEKFADRTVKCIDDEIPFEIPQSWCWVRLGSIIDFSKSNSVKPNEIAPDAWILDLEDIEKDTGVLLAKKRMKDIQSKSDKHIFYSGNVLYSKLRPYLNKVIIADENGYCTSEILAFDFGMILNKYAQIYLMSPYFVDYAMSDAYGVKMPRLGSKQGNNALMPLPPFKEQVRIAEQLAKIAPIVNRYASSQSELDRLNAELFEKLKKSVLQEAIQGKLVPQCPNDEPASVLLERIRAEKAKLFKEGKLKKKDLVDSVIFKGEDNKYYETIDGKTECIDERIPFELPHNWCWATLGNLVQNCSGLAYKKENLDERSTSYIRVLRGGNIDDGQWTMKDDDVMIASKFVKPELLLTAGTFITPAVTSIEQMGKTALVRDDQPQTVVGGFVLMLLPFLRDWSLLDYLELIFQSEYYKGYCRSITNKSGQAFYNLSRQKLMQFLVPLPPLNERIAIANEVAKINSMMR